MKVCPQCGDEYEAGVSHCTDCHVPLVHPDAPPAPPRLDALLGRFQPDVAVHVVRMLSAKGIEHDAMALGDETEILVPEGWRDDLRAELVVNWQPIIGGMEQEQVYAVLSEGGSLPGWRDAPAGAWVDREGRLQVDRPDDLELEDARRVIGPTLVVGGLTTILMAWYIGGDLQGMLLAIGIGAAGTGLFIPR